MKKSEIKIIPMRNVQSGKHYQRRYCDRIFDLHVRDVVKVAEFAGIKKPIYAAEIIRLYAELRSNNEIVAYLTATYGLKWKGATIKRKFFLILQQYIIHNYLDEFMEFSQKHSVTIFNRDLEVDKGDHTYARIIFISFLREEIGMNKKINIIL